MTIPTILKVLNDHGPQTLPEMLAHVSRSQYITRSNLSVAMLGLVRQGRLVRFGEKRNYTYALPGQAGAESSLDRAARGPRVSSVFDLAYLL